MSPILGYALITVDGSTGGAKHPLIGARPVAAGLAVVVVVLLRQVAHLELALSLTMTG